jgi:hypothetical protein
VLLVGCADAAELVACSPRVPVAAVTQTIREQATLVGDTEASRLVGSLGDTLEILAVATDDADSLAERVEPKTLTALALAAIGIDLEEAERRAATEGNA